MLRELGFTIEKKGSGMPSEHEAEDSERGRPWSREEVDLIVSDYFLMLRGLNSPGRRTARPSTTGRCSRPWTAGRRVRSSSSTRSITRRAGRDGDEPTSTATSPPGTSRRLSFPRPWRTT